MSKFHINKHGVPAPCRATKGNCPYGGESWSGNRFDTQEEAEAHAKEVNSAKHGFLPGMNSIYDKESLFLKETAIERVEIDINEL